MRFIPQSTQSLNEHSFTFHLCFIMAVGDVAWKDKFGPETMSSSIIPAKQVVEQ